MSGGTTGGTGHEPTRDPAQEALAALDRARQALNEAEQLIRTMPTTLSSPDAAPETPPEPTL